MTEELQKRWLHALAEADTRHTFFETGGEDRARKESNTKPLADLLRSNEPLDPEARKWLAELLEYHRLQRPKTGGEPRQPLYALSFAKAAKQAVRDAYEKRERDYLRGQGLTQSDLTEVDEQGVTLRSRLIRDFLDEPGVDGFTLRDCGFNEKVLRGLASDREGFLRADPSAYDLRGS